MDAQIHENAAAGLNQVEVGGGPRPVLVASFLRVDPRHLADRARAKQSVSQLDVRPEPTVVTDAEETAALLRSINHALAFGHGPGHRLLAQHVDAGSQKIAGDRRMKGVGKSHHRDVHAPEKFAVRCAPAREPEPFRESPRPLGIRIDHDVGDDLGDGADAGHMAPRCDLASADQSDPHPSRHDV